MIDVTIQPNGKVNETPWRVALLGDGTCDSTKVVIVEVASEESARCHFWRKRVSENGQPTGLTFGGWINQRSAAGFRIIYRAAQASKAA